MSSEHPEGGQKKPPIPTPAKRIPAFNIERRGDRLYAVDRLHKWFAISSLLLFVFTIAMVIQDYSREWKRYQREFTRMSVERTQQEMQQVAGTIDRTRFGQLETQIQQASAEQGQNEGQINEIQDRLDDLAADFFAADQNYRFEKATYDAQKYAYEEALAAQAANVDSLRERALETERRMNDYKGEVDRLTIAQRNTRTELTNFVGKRDQAQAELDSMLSEYNRLQARLNTLDPGVIVTSFRNAPMLDMLNPSERITQIQIPNLFYEHPFKQISRVDRCTTCHLGIDQPAYANAPQPFTAHPNMQLYLGANSSHPIDQFGCTSCHAGLDRAVDFQTAGHTPNTEEQKAEWEQKYGWHVEHYLETPMLAKNNIDSGCYKCHGASIEVPQATRLNNGRDLIRIYGCFGCHRIPGYENIRKVGPDLATVSGKLTKDWVRKWLANPKEFKSEARMPKFWYNSNNSGPAFDNRNEAEINAITEYLWSKSQPQTLPAARIRVGDAARGQQIVETVGCFGCHAVGPIPEVANRSQTRRTHGFNLASQGSKVTADWLFNWVKDPRQVWSQSKMPSLRLTDAEAADVTAYLTTLQNPEFEAKPVPEADPAALDEIVLELLRAGSTDIEARERLATMSLEQKNLMAGERLIGRYGCFGCHNVPGFENAQPIGTELTEAGSKLISQFDFGFLPIEHTRADWYAEKLKDPRIFDVGRVKRPEELLRMPNFNFSEAEVGSLTMVLTSLVRDRVPLEMRDRTDTAIAEGRQLLAEKNCKGCHIVEGAGGDIRAVLVEGQWPPNLATQGFKTQPLWLHPFLQDPNRVKLRPWLSARMPTFHFDERETTVVARYFSALDRVQYPFISTDVVTTPEKLRAGQELFTRLQCASCHPAGTVMPAGKTPEELAPDLALGHDRLRPEWILEWLRDPQAIMPGTRMPNFFADYPRSQLPDILGGDAKAQIEAIRDHLFITLGGQRSAAAGSTNE